MELVWGGAVTSAVLQGSSLESLLFLIHINDLDNGISSDISKFADDSKIGRIIRSESDVKDLQGDLDRLNELVVRWQMDFNHDKCRVMNVGTWKGKSSQQVQHKQGNTE